MLRKIHFDGIPGIRSNGPMIVSGHPRRIFARRFAPALAILLGLCGLASFGTANKHVLAQGIRSDLRDSNYRYDTRGQADERTADNRSNEASYSYDGQFVHLNLPSNWPSGCDACGRQPSCDWGCGNCCSCGPWSRFRLSGEYLLWWAKGDESPPLITTSPQGTAFEDAGVLGLPTTSILFGGDDLKDGVRSGFRGTVEYLLLPCAGLSVEATYLGLGSDHDDFTINSDGDPIVARPFFDIVTGENAADVMAFPGEIGGTTGARSSTQLDSIEILARWRLTNTPCCWSASFLAGYRYVRLDDSLLMFEDLVTQDPLTAGTRLECIDRFRTRNTFHGAELGVAAEYRRCCWSLEGLMKVALGGAEQEVDIFGQTTTTVPTGESATIPGSLLTQTSNIGFSQRNGFAVVPELGLKLNYDLFCNLRVSFGYSLLYWGKVARAAEQIDTDVNPSIEGPGPLVGPARPIHRFITNDYWAQGFNFGAEWSF